MTYRRKHKRTRPRGWFNLFLRLGGWGSLVFGVLLLSATGFSSSMLYMADKLDRDGALTTAVVADKRVSAHVDGKGRVTHDYYLSFTFKARGRGGQTVETSVGKAYFDAAGRGATRRLRYLTSDPTVLETDIGSYRRTGLALRYVGLAAGVGGLVMLWTFGQRTNRAIRARRDGRKRLAVVTGTRAVWGKVNGKRQGRLVWRETDGRTGESLTRGLDELRRLYDPGDEIVVFRLGRSAFWEGDVGPPQREVRGRG